MKQFEGTLIRLCKIDRDCVMSFTFFQVFKILVPPFHFLFPQLYLSRGTKPPVKNFSGQSAFTGDLFKIALALLFSKRSRRSEMYMKSKLWIR